MITNSTTSLNMLNSFFKNELSNLDIPDLVRIDTSGNYIQQNGLVLINSKDPTNPNCTPIKRINLENMEQSPYILNCEELSEINLERLQQIEFSEYLVNNLYYFTTKFLHNSKIQILDLPNFKGTTTPLPQYDGNEGINSAAAEYASFWNNYWLRFVNLGNSLMSSTENSNFKFNGYWFRNNYFLKFLKLNYPYVIPLVRTAGFNTTPIGNGNGYIYVPKNLLNSYKSAINWQEFSSKFRTIEDDYDRDFAADSDSISDSWATIIAKCNSATESNNAVEYRVGDTKTLVINNIPHQFIIVNKFNPNDQIHRDPICDTEGNLTNKYASLSWMETTINRFEQVNVNDFSSESRQFSNAINFHNKLTELYEGIEEPILKSSAGIKTVIKYSRGYIDANGTFEANAPSIESGLWPPSMSELGLTSEATYSYYQNKAINYYLGATNINKINGNKISVALRDYGNPSTNYPNLLIPSDINGEPMAVATNTYGTPYLILGFCT